MITLNEYYKLYEVNTGGQSAGKLEITKTSVDRAREYAESKVDDLDKQIPDFDKNYKIAQDLAKLGSKERKDMPVVTSRDVKLFQKRLTDGHIDIHKPYADITNPKNPFPYGLTNDMAEHWLKAGLMDGDEKDDKIKVVEKKVKLSNLKPIQKTIYFDKSLNSIFDDGRTVESTKKFLTGKTFYITSSDGFILDGHHRYLTALLIDPSMKVNTLSIDLPIETLLPMMLAYGDAIGNKRNK